MTATKPPADAGFFATLGARTAAVFWAHYDKLLTGLMAAFMGWAAVYGTAWVGALPMPPPPNLNAYAKNPAAPAVITVSAIPVRDDTAVIARLSAIEAALRDLKEVARSAPRTTKPTPAPK